MTTPFNWLNKALADLSPVEAWEVWCWLDGTPEAIEQMIECVAEREDVKAYDKQEGNRE